MIRYQKKRIHGIRVKKVDRASSAYAAGIRKNHIIFAVNGEPVEDDLDFSFYSASERLEIQCISGKSVRTHVLQRRCGEFLGIEFVRMPIRRCRNRCIFCFVDQLPAGMRKNLYIKDEDYRHSFLNGNYITLCSMTDKEITNIIKLRLSPLYISVHATDPSVRTQMLGNNKAKEIVHQLRRLEENAIAFHTQIVVCPGINDGEVLEKTIKDLLAFEKGLLSIAVVPVGLTKHRKRPLTPFGRENALSVCSLVNELSAHDKKRRGTRRLFIADEFFLKADEKIPEFDYYENYPQIENGVGLIRLLLNEWKRIKSGLINGARRKKNKRKPLLKRSTYLLLTSVSAGSYLQDIIGEMSRIVPGAEFFILPVYNDFFGESVTVAGLITARDIIRTVRRFDKRCDAVIVPGVILNYRGYTLDGFSIKRIAKELKTRVEAVYTLLQLKDLISENENGRKRS